MQQSFRCCDCVRKSGTLHDIEVDVTDHSCIARRSQFKLLSFLSALDIRWLGDESVGFSLFNHGPINVIRARGKKGCIIEQSCVVM